MSIYNNTIAPTYLYIKQHSITGLKYFGKTTRNPIKYIGSGKYWKTHITKHGIEFVETIWISEPYTDKNQIKEIALKFSTENNIVESNEWANLIPENGLDGGNSTGRKHSAKTIKKIKFAKLSKTQAEKTAINEKIAATRNAKSITEKLDIEHRRITTLLSKTTEEKKAIKEKTASTKKSKTLEEKLVIKEKFKQSLMNRTPEQLLQSKLKQAKTVKEQTPEQKLAIKEKTCKSYLVTSPDGITTTILGLSPFCRANNLNVGNMHAVIQGTRAHHKGWTCTKVI